MSAIVIVAITNKYKRIFRKAGATTPAQALVPEDHGMRRSLIFKKLVRDGILLPVNSERYYLDERRDAEVTKKRRTILLISMAILILGVLLVFVIGK